MEKINANIDEDDDDDDDGSCSYFRPMFLASRRPGIVILPFKGDGIQV
jgi:hypothetical protein